MQTLKTSIPGLELLEPNVERDAAVSAGWLEGDDGHETLRLMGNPEENISESTLEREQQRIRNFIDSKTQKTWTICFEGKPIGAVWVELELTEHLPAPAIHIMLGDPSARGKGYGAAVFSSLIKHLREDKGQTVLYSRHLTSNQRAAALMKKTGFVNTGDAYKDADGLRWQNVILNL